MTPTLRDRLKTALCRLLGHRVRSNSTTAWCGRCGRVWGRLGQ